MRTFDRAITELSREELVEAFGDALEWDESGAATRGVAEIIRAIIQNERDFPSDEPPRTLRNIWYASVKPVFSKLGFLRKPLTTKASDQLFLKNRADALSANLSDAVSAGELTYADIGVVDTSRSQHHAAGYTKAAVSLDYLVSFGLYPGIILATEKETQYAELEGIAQLYGCSAISGSGEGSFAATEKLFEAIRDRVKNILILAFTDYDGFGYLIANTFAEQMRSCVRNSGEEIQVTIRRLGIDLDQLTPKEIEANKYEPTDNTINRKWFDKTGGVNGEFHGIELDSLKRARRIQIVTDGLNQITDPMEYSKRIVESYIRKTAAEALVDLAEMVDAVVGDELGNVAVPEITAKQLQELALAGETELPIECNPSRDAAIASNILERVKDLGVSLE